MEGLSVIGEFKGWTCTAILLGVICCTSCGAGATVQSVRDPHFSGQVHSLYLVVGQGGIDADYANGFVNSFKRELARRRVALTSRVVNGLELDPKLIDRDVKESGAEGVMFVIPVRGTTYYGYVIALTWDVSLFDVKSDAKVWRARVENHAGTYGTVAGMVDEAAVNIAKQLDTDRIFHGGG